MQHILFVDDDPHVLSSLKRMLKSRPLGCTCEGLTSGPDAIRRIKRGGVDLVVSDIRMPGMDGLELLAELKQDTETRHIPVVMLTAVEDVDTRNTALELGAIDFLNKPPQLCEFMARLQNILRLKFYQDQLEEQNRTLERQLLQSQKMEIVGVLTSGIAHDLNNMLAHIMGNTELALLRVDDEYLHQHLKRVADSTRHASRLVKQVLNVGKQRRSDNTICDLGTVVEESLELLSVSIPDSITVIWDGPAAPHFVAADATAMNQVLMNLFINAIDAMADGGTLTISLSETNVDTETLEKHQVSPASQYVKLDVSDTGAGIDKSTVDHIFEAFFTTKGSEQGTGLGLSVVDRIVKGLSGFITVESAREQGTTFSVYLPQKGTR